MNLTAQCIIKTEQHIGFFFFQGKGPYTFKDLRTQEWLIYAEYAIVGTVTLIIIGALGICCKKCCILLKREDDDDDNEDTNLNNRKLYFKKRQLFMSNSVRSVHWQILLNASAASPAWKDTSRVYPQNKTYISRTRYISRSKTPIWFGFSKTITSEKKS